MICLLFIFLLQQLIKQFLVLIFSFHFIPTEILINIAYNLTDPRNISQSDLYKMTNAKDNLKVSGIHYIIRTEGNCLGSFGGETFQNFQPIHFAAGRNYIGEVLL